MSDLGELLVDTARTVAGYREGLAEAPVYPTIGPDALRARFAGPLNDHPTDAADVIDELVTAVGPGLVATAGPRYFGFVIGGALDAATAADVLTTGWDQPAYNAVSAPVAAAVEETAGAWLKEPLRIPPGASFGFVTGAQGANTVGLAAARHYVLRVAGWEVERAGLPGAPRVRVIASTERHATVDRSLRFLGFGAAIVEEVPADTNGAIEVDRLADVLGEGPAAPTIVVLQAGNVNTGACDDLGAAVAVCRHHDAWVHVDGAFGLWAAASPTIRHLVAGLDGADSWGCDGHKWLNVPYDSGYVFCAHPDAHAAALAYSAAYLGGPATETLRDHVARHASHAHLGVEPLDHRGRRRPLGRRDPRRGRLTRQVAAPTSEATRASPPRTRGRATSGPSGTATA